MIFKCVQSNLFLKRLGMLRSGGVLTLVEHCISQKEGGS